MSQTLWLRCETKKFERRTPLTPKSAKRLIDAGFTLTVERDEQRIFKDSEYEAIGCKLALNNSWRSAPPGTTILGLKELPASSQEPLTNPHIFFGHCYKRQSGWSALLSRFHLGDSTLYDLEFLTDVRGRRVAAFGYYAGFTGAAVGALAFAAGRQSNEDEDGGPGKLESLRPYENEEEMINTVKAALGEDGGKDVKVLVIGALGRCGSGAVDLFRKIGLSEANILKWDLAETAPGGPFSEILAVDIFVNCIQLNSAIPPFITENQIAAAGKHRTLSVVVDVSCDTTNPFNPVPIYSVNTTLDDPCVLVDVGPGNPPMSVVSIDHLPTLLPREASEQFSEDFLPSLLEYPKSRVWADAECVFRDKVTEALKVV